MKLLRFSYAAKKNIVLDNVSALFIRGVQSSTDKSVSYSNANNQTLTAGQVLYESGISGTENYIKISVKDTVTLASTGTFEITITHFPSGTQDSQSFTYQIDGTNGYVNTSYNSKPVNEDVVIHKLNREPHTFSEADFIYYDYDGDPMDAVAIYGIVDGFEYDGHPYIEGTWISASDLDKLRYIPIDQDAEYEKDNTYKVKDIHGNISI